ncbi:nuclear pore membrane glycoprotein 210 [Anopheles darlingi]|uniref:nuclear pore membrane glycoprotein 210 n=1 Tax=Anopheles darlingi TaxID=43151 RepID=UPI00210025E1|nr:nuclear pore membrane glycoprotein 210 [Anopheles darlingi]
MGVWLQITVAALLVFSTTRFQTDATKLNYPRVLLPIFDHISVNFTLEVVEKGCFKWTSSRLDLIQITPSYEGIDDDCSYRVLVTVINKEKRRNTAIVLAEDLATGEVLRCDVILDVIDQLGVLTTTRELYLEEAPETFELWAQDAQGNAFTTLEGIEFQWQIASHRSHETRVTGDESSWSQVLRFLTFSESKFHGVPRPIEKLEVAGVQGYMVLLEGINTGSARVTARLPHTEYAHVAPVDVNIMVLANLILNPSDVYILPGDTIEFKVLQLKQGKLHEIALNSQYYLEIEDETFASIGGNVAKGLQVGRTFVLLRDRNVPHEDAKQSGEDANAKATLPRASITVVDPKKLTINLLPYYNWVTVEGESHEIALNLYTADDHQITLGPQYKIHSKFDESIFYPIRVTGNGSSIFGETVATGSTPVTGKFEKLNANAEMVVYKRLAINPPEVILPFDPNLRRQKLQFTATGGDGAYSWSSLDPNVVAISQTGLAEARLDQIKGIADFSGSSADISQGAGKVTQVKVAMSRNVRIFVSAQVMFLPPIRLDVVRYNFETVVKDYIRVHVGLWALHNGTEKPFTSCENLNFELEFSNQIFIVIDQQQAVDAGAQETTANGACRIVYLRATTVGQTNLKITYRYLDKVLSDQVSLHVFEPLAIENPVENEIVLPIGASRNLFYYKGPERIYHSEAELQRNLAYDRKALDVTEVGSGFSKDKHIVRALCKKIGDFELKLEVFNTLSTAANAVPYVTEFVTKIYCVKPRFVSLITADKVKVGCPLERRNSMMHVKTDDSDEMVIDIEVLDVHNRKLANISSLLLEWQFSSMEQQSQKQQQQGGAGEVALSLPYTQRTEVDHLEGVEIPVRDFVTLTLPRQLEASLKVKTIVSDYRAEVLKRHAIKPESPAFGVQKQSGTALVKPIIENELNFLAVNRTLLPYDRLTLFLTSDTVERIKIVQGSGFYDIKASEAGIVTVQFEATTRQLVISPRKVGEVKLEINDQCLSTEPSFLYVSVVTVGKITLLVPDRVEKTKTIEAVARLYDSNDQLLDIKRDRLELYELRTEVYNPAVLSVAYGSQANLGIGEVRYVVTGTELGESKFSVSAGNGKKMITSVPATVQVFPPLLLLPRNATIVVGSTLQIHSKGGPTPDTNIIYSVQKLDVIDVESGVVSGLRVGRSKVTGRCVGTNPTTGAQIIFSEDSIIVNVIPLEAIELRTPLARIQTGAIMPAYVWAAPSISPLVLGTVEGVKIRWSTDHGDILDIRGVFQDIGVEYLERDAIVMRVRALAPGKATLHVTLITAKGAHLTAKTDITVFRMLELESPKVIRYDSILIPPKATIQLKANLDDALYQLENESAANAGVVQVTRDGLVKSSDTVGRVQVIASSQEQSLTIPLEVKHVQYVMATLQPGTVKLRQVAHSIPQGFALSLKVSLHDNLGNEFSHGVEDVATLRHRLSKRGNVLINTGTDYSVALELIRETSDMLVVALRDQTGVKYAEDYIKLVVGEQNEAVVSPGQRIFSVGDVVCFGSPLLNNDLRWSSSDERAVKIDPKSGVAQMLASRSSGSEDKILISHGSRRSGGGVTFGVEVLEADRIEFFKSYDIFNLHSYRGHLVIKNHQQHDKLANVIAQNASSCQEQIERSYSGLFACQLLVKVGTVDLLQHFKTYPGYDAEIGAYCCNIDLLTTIDDVINVIGANDFSIALEVRLLASGSSAGLVDTSALKIVPPVRVEPEAFSVEQLGKQGLMITGLGKLLEKVSVTSSNPAVLEVKLKKKLSGAYEYKLELLETYREEWADSLVVLVHSPHTKQTIEVPIRSPMAPRKCATQPFNSTPDLLVHYMSNIGLIISTVVVLAATVWVIVFCFPQRNRTNSPNASVFSPFKNEHNLSSYDNRVSSSPFASPLDKRSSNLQPSPSSSPYPGSPGHSFGGSQGNLSNDFNTSGGSLGSPIYGDATILSPQKRVNRRYM